MKFSAKQKLLTTFNLLALALTASTMNVTAATFTLDPTQSHLTIAGSLAGSNIREQGPNSLTTTFSGNIKADITGSTIRFPGDSAMDASVNGTWQPGVGGAAGSAPADYAGIASSIIGTVTAAIRNVAFDLRSDAIPLDNGNFSATNIIFAFPTNSTASFDYRSTLLTGGKALAGESTNKAATVATLITTSTNQILTISIDSTFRFEALNPDDSSVRFTGQLVARRELAGTPVTLQAAAAASGTLRIEVSGADGSFRLESSTNLVNWAPANVPPVSDQGKTVYTPAIDQALEFFRVAKP